MSSNERTILWYKSGPIPTRKGYEWVRMDGDDVRRHHYDKNREKKVCDISARFDIQIFAAINRGGEKAVVVQLMDTIE